MISPGDQLLISSITASPADDQQRIQEIICDHASVYAGFHDLKTRRSGPEIFIEFHLVLPGDISVLQVMTFPITLNPT